MDTQNYTFRMTTDLHRRVRIAAAEDGVPMRTVVLNALEAELERRAQGRKADARR